MSAGWSDPNNVIYLAPGMRLYQGNPAKKRVFTPEKQFFTGDPPEKPLALVLS